MENPKLRLSRLRDIGWKYWDPIGLLRPEQHWSEEPFADEYDRYLIKAAGQLRRGEPDEKVAKYLENIECVGMGLGKRAGQFTRAMRVVKAINDDKELWNYD